MKETDIHRRMIWEITRSVLEADGYKHRKSGVKHRRHWDQFDWMIQIFGRLLRLAPPLYRRGYRNALDVQLQCVALPFSDLPEAFHGYRILHMTDLHLDLAPGLGRRIRRKLKGLETDLVVMTGDYRRHISGSFQQVLAPMREIVSAVSAADGILATLGNHDTYRMAASFEQMGIRVLANESVRIVRGEEDILVTGLDDPYCYYTDQALYALEETPSGFKIALVHAPSLYDAAAECGYRLYLCGHTHGGQICLPGGKPLITHVHYGRRYYRGLWRYREMAGYTGQGTGTAGIPIRFNTQSEITLFRLMRA